VKTGELYCLGMRLLVGAYDTALRQASTYVPNSLGVVPTSFLGSAVPIVVFFRDVTVDGMFVCESGRTGEYSACQLCESPLVWRRCNRLGYL